MPVARIISACFTLLIASAAICIRPASAQEAASFQPGFGVDRHAGDSSDYVELLRLVRTGGGSEAVVTLRIAPGYHINANPPRKTT